MASRSSATCTGMQVLSNFELDLDFGGWGPDHVGIFDFSPDVKACLSWVLTPDDSGAKARN